MAIEKTTIKGQLGNIYDKNGELQKYNFDKTPKGLDVINIKIKPKDKDWTLIVAWDKQANRLKDAIDKDGFTKFSFTGNMKEKELKSGAKEPYLSAHDIAMHRKIEIEGKITSVRDNQVNGKNIKEALVVDKISNEQGEFDKTYKVSIFDNVNGFKETDIKAGQTIAVNGEGTFLQGKKGQEFVSIQAYDLAKDKETLKDLITKKDSQKVATDNSKAEKPAKEEKKSQVKKKTTKPKKSVSEDKKQVKEKKAAKAPKEADKEMTR